MKRLVLAGALALGTGFVQAQAVPDELLKEAIAFGYANARGGDAFEPYDLMGGVKLSTPFSRAARAAADAKSKYMEISLAEARKAAGTNRVVAAIDGLVDRYVNPGTVINFKHMVVVLGDGTVVQPLTVRLPKKEWGNLAGARQEVVGVEAEFPMSVLVEGAAFQAIHENGAINFHKKLTADLVAKLR